MGGRWEAAGGDIKRDLEWIASDDEVRRRWPQTSALFAELGGAIREIVGLMEADLTGRAPILESDPTFDNRTMARTAQVLQIARSSATMPSVEELIDMDARPYLAPASIREANERLVALRAEVDSITREMAYRSEDIAAGRRSEHSCQDWFRRAKHARFLRQEESYALGTWLRMEGSRLVLERKLERQRLDEAHLAALKTKREEAERLAAAEHKLAEAADPHSLEAAKAELSKMQSRVAKLRAEAEELQSRVDQEREREARNKAMEAKLRDQLTRVREGLRDPDVHVVTLRSLHENTAQTLDVLDLIRTELGTELPTDAELYYHKLQASLPHRTRLNRREKIEEFFAQARSSCDVPTVLDARYRVDVRGMKYTLSASREEAQAYCDSLDSPVPKDGVEWTTGWLPVMARRIQLSMVEVERQTLAQLYRNLRKSA